MTVILTVCPMKMQMRMITTISTELLLLIFLLLS